MRLGIHFSILLGALMAQGLLANRVLSGVISSSGAIQLIDESLVPNNISEGNWESDDFLRVFSERQNYMLPVSVNVDITNPGTYGRTAGFVPVSQSIGAGSFINSHYMHFDPIGTPGNMTRAGSITFDTDVVGIIVGVLNGTNVGDPNNTLGLSNPILGIPRITYDVAIADLFLGGGDQLTLSGDRRSVSFLFISGRGSDNVRILTSAIVPEPERTSAYLLIVALLGLLIHRKHRLASLATE
jgi:hypothetical protein